jgi:predicted phage terminase large subunit-like protein
MEIYSEKQSATLEEIELELSKRYLAEFIKQAWHIVEPTPYVHGWHIDAICEHLEAITNGQITRLLINVIPGGMKSLICNVFWPAWEWGPRKLSYYKFLAASHKQDLAVRDNIRMRRLVKSEWYRSRYPHVILQKDQDAKIKFENTNTGFKEAMAAGSITGSRGDRVVIDDPLSVDDAESKVVLDSREIWFTEAVPTRLINPEKSAILVIMQRLKAKDTSGVILERDLGYVHLMLPMEFEPQRKCKTIIGFEDPRKEDGELLFPERFPRHVVERDKKALGRVAVAGQFQQRPTPREGSLIKVEWLQNRFNIPRDGNGNIILREFRERYQSWDTAFKDGEQNDYSVCTTWGLKDNGFYLLHRLKVKLDFPALEQKCIELATQYVPNQLLIEDKASGQSLIQAIKRRTRLPVKAVKIDRDKIARANAVSGYIEAGRIWLPNNEPWVSDYIDEITTFPAAAHDDQMDSTTQFLLEIALRRESSLQIIQGSMMGR